MIVPIHVLPLGDTSGEVLSGVIRALNKAQESFRYSLPPSTLEGWGIPYRQRAYSTNNVWEIVEKYRLYTKAYLPFVVSVVDGGLASNSLGNLFGSHDEESRTAVFTVKDWEKHFAPPSVECYIAYYLVRYALSFLAPGINNHLETRGCFYDKKINKKDIKLSMTGDVLCDQCQWVISEKINHNDYKSLMALVNVIRLYANAEASTLQVVSASRPTVFVGSSVEGLSIARLLQVELKHSASVTIWSQGVFGLSQGTLEALTRAAKSYEYAILVLTPDDVVVKRSNAKNMPRDNVLFELGLFIGSLGRDRVFMLRSGSVAMDMPSDLAGITPVSFLQNGDSPTQADIGPAATEILRAMGLI